MKIRKSVCIALIAAMVCSASLASCGGSDSDETNSSAQSAQADASKDAVAIADKLRLDIKFVDSLNELSPEMTEKLLGVSQDWYTAGKVYVGSGGATAEEIACFEAKDPASADSIKSALEARVEAQKKAFENYQPQEMDKLDSAVIKVQGSYVFMCISDDNSLAESIIG